MTSKEIFILGRGCTLPQTTRPEQLCRVPTGAFYLDADQADPCPTGTWDRSHFWGPSGEFFTARVSHN